jgi:DNA repair photolyase
MAIIYEPRGRAREYAPLAANLYSGCSHGCVYCYAPSATFRTREVFHGTVKPRKNVLAELEKDARKLGPAGGRVLLSFTTDPYQPLEESLGITRQAIQVMHRYGLKVEILTKGGTRAARDFDLLGEGDAFATTMTFLTPAKSLEWEPGAALPADRIAAIKEAHARGIETWVSLEPVIEPDESLEIIRQTHTFVDLYKVGVLNYDARAKETDWPAFASAVKALLERLGKEYYLKDDLRAYLAPA